MPTPTQKFKVTFRYHDGSIRSDTFGTEELARDYVRILSNGKHMVLELRDVYKDKILDF